MLKAIADFFAVQPEALVEIIIGIVGFIGVILSLKADRRVKIAEFIADYNLTFLTNPEFSQVERLLEGCRCSYVDCCEDGRLTEEGKKRFEASCDSIFHSKDMLFELDSAHNKFDSDGAVSEYYQGFVNYLVYLESFSTLITQKRVRIKDVDDLFGYRFFIAVNNPVMQKNELIPYAAFYQGIMKAYKVWTEYYKKHGDAPEIEPMHEYALSKIIE